MAIPLQNALVCQYFMSFAQQRCIVDLTYLVLAVTGDPSPAAVTRELAVRLVNSAAQPFTALRAYASVGVQFDFVKVIGLFEGLTPEVAQQGSGASGTRAIVGDPLSSYDAVGWFTGAPAYRRRGASFRFPGLYEGDKVGNVWGAAVVTGALVTALQAQLNAIHTLTGGSMGAATADVTTAVVKRIKDVSARGKEVWRLPTEVGDPVDVMTVPDWQVNPLATTQVGRKQRRV